MITTVTLESTKLETTKSQKFDYQTNSTWYLIDSHICRTHSVHSHKIGCPSGTYPVTQREKSRSGRWKYIHQNTSERETVKIIRPKADQWLHRYTQILTSRIQFLWIQISWSRSKKFQPRILNFFVILALIQINEVTENHSLLITNTVSKDKSKPFHSDGEVFSRSLIWTSTRLLRHSGLAWTFSSLNNKRKTKEECQFLKRHISFGLQHLLTILFLKHIFPRDGVGDKKWTITNSASLNLE